MPLTLPQLPGRSAGGDSMRIPATVELRPRAPRGRGQEETGHLLIEGELPPGTPGQELPQGAGFTGGMRPGGTYPFQADVPVTALYLLEGPEW